MVIKPFQQENKEQLKKFFTGLSENTIFHWNRFGDVRQVDIAEKAAQEQVSKLSQEEKGFVATNEQNEIMGYGYLRYFPDKEQKKYTTSLGIVVSDKFQGQGVGKELMNYMIEEAKKQNMKKVWLGVYVDNEKAIEFYKKFGFEIEGVFMYDEYFNDKPRHVISMALFLDEDIKDSRELRKQLWK